jgi:hypothetical protein
MLTPSERARLIGTEDTIASVFAELYGHKVRFCAVSKTWHCFVRGDWESGPMLREARRISWPSDAALVQMLKERAAELRPHILQAVRVLCRDLSAYALPRSRPKMLGPGFHWRVLKMLENDPAMRVTVADICIGKAPAMSAFVIAESFGQQTMEPPGSSILE